MKTIKQGIGTVLLAIACLLLSLTAASNALALGAGAYAVDNDAFYANPDTGKIDDGGDASIGEGMSRNITYGKSLLEVEDDRYYVTLRIKMISYISSVDIKTQTKKGDGASYKSVSYKVTGENKTENTRDFRFEVADPETYIQPHIYVEPMGRTVIYFVAIKPDTAKLDWGTFAEYNNSSSSSSEVAKPDLPSGISIQDSSKAESGGKGAAASSTSPSAPADSSAVLPSAKPLGEGSTKSPPQVAKPQAADSVQSPVTAKGAGGSSEAGANTEADSKTAPEAANEQGQAIENVADHGEGDRNAEGALFSDGESDFKEDSNSSLSGSVLSNSESNESLSQGGDVDGIVASDQNEQSAGEKNEGAISETDGSSAGSSEEVVGIVEYNASGALQQEIVTERKKKISFVAASLVGLSALATLGTGVYIGLCIMSRKSKRSLQGDKAK